MQVAIYIWSLSTLVTAAIYFNPGLGRFSRCSGVINHTKLISFRTGDVILLLKISTFYARPITIYHSQTSYLRDIVVFHVSQSRLMVTIGTRISMFFGGFWSDSGMLGTNFSTGFWSQCKFGWVRYQLFHWVLVPMQIRVG